MLKRIQFPLFTLSVLLAALLFRAAAMPGLAIASHEQVEQAPSLAIQLQAPTPSPSTEEVDNRPVERNPFLVAGGVLIFLVILFGVWRYSRPADTAV